MALGSTTRVGGSFNEGGSDGSSKFLLRKARTTQHTVINSKAARVIDVAMIALSENLGDLDSFLPFAAAVLDLDDGPGS